MTIIVFIEHFSLYTQSVFSAAFYGTSYVVFPSFAASEHLDISFNFQTNFENGLVMFTGSASHVCEHTYVHVDTL